MSDLIDQRGKGQANPVSNGPGRDKEEKFDAYLQPSQTSYGPGNMSSPGVAENSFLPSYYTPNMSFNYMGQGMNDGAWSNGGDQPIFPMSTYDYNGIFNSFGFPPYGWDYSSANDYWGTVGQGRKDTRPYNDTDYYQPEMMGGDPYNMVNGELDHDINSVDQGLKGMTLGGEKNMGENGPGDMGVVDNSNVSGSVAPPMQTAMSSAPKKTSWAAIASQPARPQPMKRLIPRAPVNPKQQHNMDIGTWDGSRGGNLGSKPPPAQRQTWNAPRRQMASTNAYSSGTGGGAANNNQSNSNGSAGYTNSTTAAPPAKNNPILEKLRSANMYNPKEFNLNPKGARYFIIKSYSEDDIHRSIKYSIWCSTEHGNKRLDSAYREREGKGPIYLFFSVNGSGHFCGMAQMMSAVDYNSSSGVWAQDKWKGVFEVKWIYVKDVPNGSLRHIRLENNENKPVTNSRDTQEVPPEKGKQVLKILHNYHHNTSIFDDFVHYEKRQEEDQTKETGQSGPPPQRPQGQGHSNSQQKDRPERRPRQN